MLKKTEKVTDRPHHKKTILQSRTLSKLGFTYTDCLHLAYSGSCYSMVGYHEEKATIKSLMMGKLIMNHGGWGLPLVVKS